MAKRGTARAESTEAADLRFPPARQRQRGEDAALSGSPPVLVGTASRAALAAVSGRGESPC